MNVTLLLAAVALFLLLKGRRFRLRLPSFRFGGAVAYWLFGRFPWLDHLRTIPRLVRPVLWTLAVLIVGWLVAPVWTVVLVVLVGATAYFGRGLFREHRRHFQDLVMPLWMAVADLLDVPKGEAVRDWLRVPHRLDGESARVVLRIPQDFRGTDAQRAEIADLVARRLPGEWESSWNWRTFRVTFAHPPAPPKFVGFADVQAEMYRGESARPLIGLGTRAEVVRGDFDQEAPHWALTMGTGAGKSSFLRLTIAQLARRTADPDDVEQIDILDPKRVSLNCFRGVPGVRIHKTAEHWIAAIKEFRAEMERRYEDLDEDDNATFPRRFLVIEEMNSFTRLIKEHWNEIREKSDPMTPPVIGDLNFILFQGRQAKMHVLEVLQQANARAMGGSEARDQFGMKILARFSPAVWNMLVGTYPRPKSSRHPGRAIVMVGDHQRTVQMAFITPEEARTFALDGRTPEAVAAPPSRVLSIVKEDAPHPGTMAATVPGQSTDKAGRTGQVVDMAPAAPAEPDPTPDPLVGLRAAAEFLGMEPEAFKKARQRTPIDGEFRSGSSPAWLPDALTEWHLNRPRAGARPVPERSAS
ncbi:FtsK/SpoIIIE domain-containing protein [Streptomyces sp. NPDC052101]|uniref:FtsK/SpoIIIE domain-containing protein n=1 Tax=Streptomyces sp. NPDC052101 TaxID=3155763 RepID=UPI00342F9F8F